MSQENKGEDRLEQVIQGYEERITKLEAKLDAAREAHDKVSIESLQRELVELRNRVYIQRRCERIAKLEAKLDAAREARDEVSIKDLEEELDKLRDHVERLRAMRLGIGVGSSTQSKCYAAGCVLSFVAKVLVDGCYSSWDPLCCIFDNHSSC